MQFGMPECSRFACASYVRALPESQRVLQLASSHYCGQATSFVRIDGEPDGTRSASKLQNIQFVSENSTAFRFRTTECEQKAAAFL